MIDFAKSIKEYRMVKLLTQEEFANMLGVSINSVNRWENGHFEPTMQVKKKLKALFVEANIIQE